MTVRPARVLLAMLGLGLALGTVGAPRIVGHHGRIPEHLDQGLELLEIAHAGRAGAEAPLELLPVVARRAA